MSDEAVSANAPYRLSLPFTAASAGVARRRLVDWLARTGCRAGADDCRVVVTELIGNAVRHARPLSDGTVEVNVTRTAGDLDIAVSDGGAATSPQAGPSDPMATSGRGLALVEALSARWWVESGPSRTTVHARIACA